MSEVARTDGVHAIGTPRPEGTGDRPGVGGVMLRWWGRCLDVDNGAARAARARLRHASGPADVLALAVTHELYHDIRNAEGGRDLREGSGPQRLTLIAAVLAGIESHDGATLARRFGPLRSGEAPALSSMRFQRLLRAPDDWALAVALRRALPLVNRTANVTRLGTDLLHWGERTRSRWCFDYFGAPSPQGLRDDANDHKEDT